MGAGLDVLEVWKVCRPASSLYPATAARQGGRVAASLVDSCGVGTADIRG